ncbi:MAG TPA: glutamate racemase [Bacillota bacterium]|jgi:glutamate racemase|nr:glutamate racemase [Fastidiosipila sp.]HPX93923.1 glutamate racemase [Bacillota bacterium]HQB81833.1 glutamate racemase [Bacillota bacterium]
MREASLPIGVFDSGIGGLTVLKELQRSFPGEHLIYVGDLARSPYGSKSAETIRHYAGQITRYLLSRQVKLIVVACNTASAAAGATVRQLAAPVPVLEVVELGAEAALDAVGGGGRIGILATSTTVESGIYSDKIRALSSSKGIPVPRIMQKACPLFVPLVEEGIWEGDLADQIARHYLEEMSVFQPEAVILGCTHYPLLKGAIAKSLPAGTLLIESAPAVVRAAGKILDKSGMRSLKTKDALTEYYVSDSVEAFSRHAGRILDRAVDLVHHVDLDACEGREE